MSNKLLQKLSSVVARPDDETPSIAAADESRLNTVLEEHLDVIAGAHSSVHGSVHKSQIK